MSEQLGPGDLVRAARSATAEYTDPVIEGLLAKPVIILSAPRAGSTVLFEQLARAIGLWTIGGESHGILRAFPKLRAQNDALDSGRLDASHASHETVTTLRACFLMLLRNHEGRPFLRLPPEQRPSSVTLLEKTPRNALNVPFLNAVFPRARFIYLHRDARQNVASLIEAWTLGLQTGRFVTFRQLPGWDRPAWCFLLPPGWRSMVGKGIADIAAFQWAETNRIVLQDLDKLGSDRWCAVSYDELVKDPGATLKRLCQFAGAEAPAISAGGSLPLSRTTLTSPDPDKWKKYSSELEAVRSILEPVEMQIASAISAQ